MGEKTPRRLMRFDREKFTDEELKEKSTSLAIKEVDHFREKHDRYPAPAELDQITENVFEQLRREMESTKHAEESRANITDDIDLGEERKPSKGKKEKNLLEQRRERRGVKPEDKKEARRRGRKAEEEMEEEPEDEEDEGEDSEKSPIKPLGEDFAKEPEMAEKPGEVVNQTDELRQIAGLDELSNLEDGLSEEDDFDVIEKETKATINSCPRCNNKAKELIYCPNCGTAFCDHCAKKIEVQTEAAKYTCPNCKTEFKKRKPVM